MRVTNNSFSDSLLNHLQSLSRRQSAIQTQISTGQRVQDASDDPLAAQEILGLRDDAAATAQYQKNIEIHQEFAGVTHGIIQSLQKIMNRAQEIAFSVDDIDSKEDLKTY